MLVVMTAAVCATLRAALKVAIAGVSGGSSTTGSLQSLRESASSSVVVPSELSELEKPAVANGSAKSAAV